MWNWVKVDIDYCLKSALRPTQIATLTLLAAHSNQEGYCTLPYSVIASRLRVSRRSALRFIKDLVDAGFLDRLNRADEDRFAVFAIKAGVAISSNEPRRPRSFLDRDDTLNDAQLKIDGMTPIDI